MFRGNYNFFDYKYNISGYTGQDYGSIAQNIYLFGSIALLNILLLLLRKISKEKVLTIVRIVGIFMTLLYIGKTTWESIYDIKLSGDFNTGLLPFDTCSIVMLACLIAGFGKGKIKKMAECWLTTGSIVGGIATMLYLNAFKYYPFFSFGAFYSMIWHFLMVFIGLLLIVTNYVELKYKNVLLGFLFHLIISLIIIPIDFIFNFDFMLYHDLGGIPIFENIATKFTAMNIPIINPVMMLILYFVAFNIIYVMSLIIKSIKYNNKIR
jgi:hypothetical protein